MNLLFESSCILRAHPFLAIGHALAHIVLSVFAVRDGCGGDGANQSQFESKSGDHDLFQPYNNVNF
jgi:hypothetical protein